MRIFATVSYAIEFSKKKSTKLKQKGGFVCKHRGNILGHIDQFREHILILIFNFILNSFT